MVACCWDGCFISPLLFPSTAEDSLRYPSQTHIQVITSSIMIQRIHHISSHPSQSRLPLRLPKPNPHPRSRLQHNLRLEHLLPILPIPLHPLKPLQDPHNRIPHLRQRKLLPDTDARPAIKRDIRPTLRRPVLPPLRREHRHVRERGRRLRIQVAPALHQQGRVPDGGILADADGLQAVGPAAVRQRGVVQGQADVEGHARVQAQRLAEDVLQVAHVFQVVVGGGRAGAEAGEDLGAEGADDGRVGGELVEEPGEHGGGGVAAGEEDGYDLVADGGAVAGEAREGVQEGVAGGGFGFGFEVGGRQAQGVVDVGGYEGVEDFDAREEGAAGGEPVEGAGDGTLAIDLVKFISAGAHPAREMMFCTRCTSAKASANLTCGLAKLFIVLPRRKSVMASKVYLRRVSAGPTWRYQTHLGRWMASTERRAQKRRLPPLALP